MNKMGKSIYIYLLLIAAFVFVINADVYAQTDVTGTVRNADTGETLPGANVAIEGTNQGASTDADGQYTISNVEPGTYTFIATFIGFQPNERVISISPGQETINLNFSMLPAETALEELVVVGYGQQERGELTGSISSVTGEALNNISTSNFEQALVGQAAGVLATPSDGQPGEGANITIRGAATLGNTNPLYVIDGVPTSNLEEINMSNIESIEILKDASATAIYGSRASNGVVMVTTKRGRAGATEVQVSATTGFNTVPESRRIDMMNTQQFYEFSLDAYNNAQLPTPLAWTEPYLSENLQVNTDWQDHLFRTAAVQDYNVTVSGGSEDAVYSFASGYRDEKGVIVSNSFNRASFRINSEFYIGENNWLTIGENVQLSQVTSRGGASANTLKETFQQSPTVKLRCPENLGGFCGPTSQTSPGFRLNQVALLHLEDNEDINRRLLGTAYAIVDIFDNLSYRLNVSADLGLGNATDYAPRYDLESNVNGSADLSNTRSEGRNIVIDNTVNYNVILNDVHEIEILAGYSQEERRTENLVGTAEDFPGPTVRTISGSTGSQTVSGGISESALQSILGRVVYGYDDRYRVQFAVRRDGSSRFGANSRWGTFPSLSASWRIDNESFMEQYGQISQLTLRGSWGLTGSQDIGDYSSLASVEPVASYVFGASQTEAPGSAIMQPGNSNLKWQETEQIDIGLDIGLFNNRFTFVFDYFQKNTDNLLLQVPIPSTSGIYRGNGAQQNVGEVKNSGLEFAVGYQQSSGDFSYSINANLATVKNEVIYLGGVESIINRDSDELGYGETIAIPGKEIGAFYGYIADGVFADWDEVYNHATQNQDPGGGRDAATASQFTAPGDLRFRDINNDGQVNSQDRTIIGSPFPDFFYGLGASLNYKNWGLRIQLDGVQGRDIMALRSDNDPKGFNNATTVYLDRWTPNNRDTDVFRPNTVDPNTNLRSSTYRVKDGSYLAVRNITLGYTFDTNALSRIVNLRNLRMYLSSSNLFWFTGYEGYNPEVGGSGLNRSVDNGSYPVPRNLQFGIEFGF